MPPQERELTPIRNPFHAPVYYYEKIDSTQQAARQCVAEGCPNGTFIYAGFQTQGRGRLTGRQWLSSIGENLLGTLILQKPASTDFTLRIGLAVAMTLDTFLPTSIRTAVKWPNDVLINGKKIAGILCETAKNYILAGFGINILQTNFLQNIGNSATSLALTAGTDKCPPLEVFIPALLEQIQSCMTFADWHKAISNRLWKRGSMVRFMRGQQETDIIEGILTGIAADGAVCIADSEQERRYYSGELLFI